MFVEMIDYDTGSKFLVKHNLHEAKRILSGEKTK
jgi:hypothetical protein